MKWMTIKEYAEMEGITLAGAYKRVNEERIKSARKYGKVVVYVKQKETK